jgi:formylmethanofuran dehydrogenase subunit C
VGVRRTVLRLREPIALPVEADAISPDRFAGLDQREVAALPILRGRRWVTVDDLFSVEGEGAQDILIEGDLSHVKRIGQGMTQGTISILGDVGMHLGAQMRGGEITVQGDVAAWCGAQMASGTIRIHGHAGPMLGGVYTGETRGMRGGVILVDGQVGVRVGERMRRGLIVVGGDAGEFAGARMIAGSLVVLGALGGRAGAGMKRGTIVALGGLADGPLPTFNYACTYRPTFLRYTLRHLQAMGLPVTQEQVAGRYRRYTGDVNTIGKGEILVYD